jgi:iron complex outermembrane receptor protein
MIQAVTVTPSTLCGATAVCTQMQNVGRVSSKGIELGITSFMTERLELGANYTLLNRTNKSTPAILLFDVPKHKLFSYAKWQISDPLSLLASVEANSWRYSSTTGTRIASGFGIANVKAMYQIDKAWSAEIGINNLLDKNYMLIEGYPLEGRNFIANTTYKF